MLDAMSPHGSHAEELLLMERYAVYCTALAETSKHSRATELLRLLAQDLTLERRKHYRLLLATTAKPEPSAAILKFHRPKAVASTRQPIVAVHAGTGA